jgi:hypothetical protein
VKVSSGQLTQNNWLLGGNLAYTRYAKGSQGILRKGSSLDASLNSGYFLIDKLAGGIRTNYEFGKSKYPQPDGSTNVLRQTTLGLGPFIRYYFLRVENRVNLFSDAGFLYSVNTNNTISTGRQTSNSWSSSFGVGTVVFLNTSVGIEFLLAYDHYKEIDVDSRDNQLQFKIGLQFHLERE